MKPNTGQRLFSTHLRYLLNEHVRQVLGCDGNVIVHHMTDTPSQLRLEVEYYHNGKPQFCRVEFKDLHDRN